MHSSNFKLDAVMLASNLRQAMHLARVILSETPEGKTQQPVDGYIAIPSSAIVITQYEGDVYNAITQFGYDISTDEVTLIPVEEGTRVMVLDVRDGSYRIFSN